MLPIVYGDSGPNGGWKSFSQKHGLSNGKEAQVVANESYERRGAEKLVKKQVTYHPCYVFLKSGLL